MFYTLVVNLCKFHQNPYRPEVFIHDDMKDDGQWYAQLAMHVMSMRHKLFIALLKWWKTKLCTTIWLVLPDLTIFQCPCCAILAQYADRSSHFCPLHNIGTFMSSLCWSWWYVTGWAHYEHRIPSGLQQALCYAIANCCLPLMMLMSQSPRITDIPCTIWATLCCTTCAEWLNGSFTKPGHWGGGSMGCFSLFW